MIITEIGHNHLGELEYADQYIEALISAHVDGITFQYRELDRYAGDGEKLRLPDHYLKEALKKIKSSGIKAGIALADIEKIDFFESYDTDFYKVLSKDIKDVKLITQLINTGKPVSVSTGMSNVEEIRQTVSALRPAHGQLSLIHTSLTYEPSDVNLRAIPMMRAAFNLPVGFGSHARNSAVLYLALAYDPSDIWFYVKGDRGVKHPDEDHAISLKECAHVIKNLRELPTMIGSETKVKMENEIKKAGL